VAREVILTDGRPLNPRPPHRGVGSFDVFDHEVKGANRSARRLALGAEQDQVCAAAQFEDRQPLPV
jgi:hypothetical protein